MLVITVTITTPAVIAAALVLGLGIYAASIIKRRRRYTIFEEDEFKRFITDRSKSRKMEFTFKKYQRLQSHPGIYRHVITLEYDEWKRVYVSETDIEALPVRKIIIVVLNNLGDGPMNPVESQFAVAAGKARRILCSLNTENVLCFTAIQ